MLIIYLIDTWTAKVNCYLNYVIVITFVYPRWIIYCIVSSQLVLILFSEAQPFPHKFTPNCFELKINLEDDECL